MKATDILMDEHRVIEQVLGSIETAAVRFEKGEGVRPEYFVDAARFIKGFADGCHHKKEEGVLFTALLEAGLPAQDGPVAVMLAEHDQGRAYTAGMLHSAERVIAGDAASKRDVVRNALGYVVHLRQHIAKEDGVLFPIAAEIIPVDQHGVLADRFDTIEHVETGEGVHEKYLALAETLARQAVE